MASSSGSDKRLWIAAGAALVTAGAAALYLARAGGPSTGGPSAVTVANATAVPAAVQAPLAGASDAPAPLTVASNMDEPDVAAPAPAPAPALAPASSEDLQSEALIKFIEAVGQDVDVSVAIFWLEASSYQVDAAVSAYYEEQFGRGPGGGGGGGGGASTAVGGRMGGDGNGAMSARGNVVLGGGGRGRPPVGQYHVVSEHYEPADGEGAANDDVDELLAASNGGSVAPRVRFGGTALANAARGMGLDMGGLEEVTTPGGGISFRAREAIRAAAPHSVSVGALEYPDAPSLRWESNCTRVFFADEPVMQPGFLLGGTRAAGSGVPRVCAACARGCQDENTSIQIDSSLAAPFVCACAEWASGPAGCVHSARARETLDPRERATVLMQLAAASAPMQSVIRKLLASVTNENTADMVELNEFEVLAPEFALALQLHIRMRFLAGPASDFGMQLTGLGVFFRDWSRGSADVNAAVSFTALAAAARVLELCKEREPAAWGQCALALARAYEARADGARVANLRRAETMYTEAMQVFAADDAVMLTTCAEALDRIAALVQSAEAEAGASASSSDGASASSSDGALTGAPPPAERQ